MRKLIALAFTAILCIGFIQDATAQKKYSEGKITYDISFPNLPEEMKAYSSMLPKEMVMFFKKEKSRIEMGMGMGESILLVDNEKKEMVQLIDMMGQKSGTKISMDEQEEEKPDYEIEYTDEKKEIAGYACKKAVVSVEEDELVVWYTEDFEVKGGGNPTQTVLGEIKGFPMEYSMNNGQFDLMFTFSGIEKMKVDDEMFEVPADYTMKTPEEFRGGMMGN